MCSCEVYCGTHPNGKHLGNNSYVSYNNSGHVETCVRCGVQISETHNFSEFSYNSLEHYGTCECGYVGETEAHTASEYVAINSIQHNIYCKCGYFIRVGSHSMVTIGRFARCTDCGIMIDTWSTPTIKGLLEDDTLHTRL